MFSWTSKPAQMPPPPGASLIASRPRRFLSPSRCCCCSLQCTRHIQPCIRGSGWSAMPLLRRLHSGSVALFIPVWPTGLCSPNESTECMEFFLLNRGWACCVHACTSKARHRAWHAGSLELGQVDRKVGGVLPCSMPTRLPMGSSHSFLLVGTPLRGPPLTPNRADLRNR